MNESEMIKKIADQTTVITARKEVKCVIEAFLTCLREALKDGETVKIKDLGTFTPTTTKTRIGRNPKTGEAIEIPEKRTVKFRPSPNFIKNILNGGQKS